MRSLIVAATIAAVSFGASAATNLVTDGSFEDVTVRGGNWMTVASMTGWSATNGIELRNDIVGTAENKSNFVELDTYANSSISQTLSTVAGQKYELTFWVEDRPDLSLAAQKTTDGLSFGVTDDTAAATVLASGAVAGGSTQGWTEITAFFTADSSETVLTLSAAGTSDSYGSSLDNVSVTAVPEPASIAMLASGLALVGLSRRRVPK